MISFPWTLWASVIYQSYNGIKIILTKCKQSCFSKRAVSALFVLLFLQINVGQRPSRNSLRGSRLIIEGKVCRQHG